MIRGLEFSAKTDLKQRRRPDPEEKTPIGIEIGVGYP